MRTRVLVFVVGFSLVSISKAIGQTTGGCTKAGTPSTKVGCLLHDIFAAGAVQSTSHLATFKSDDFSVSAVTAVNTSIATHLTALPIPSTASSFTYSLDPNGVYTRSAQSFGRSSPNELKL